MNQDAPMSGPSPSQGAPAHRLPTKPSRILVADDEYLVAAELTSWLADGGYTTIGPVGTGNEAIRLARSALPDMCLLDIRMPNGDGLTAAKTIMEDPGLPVVILTAYWDKEYVQVAEAAGVFAYLIKPADPNQLMATVEIAWGRYKRFMEEATDRQKLARRLEERKIVEQAKWILVERAGLDEPRALRMLQDRARRNRERLVAVAQRVISAGEGGHTPAK